MEEGRPLRLDDGRHSASGFSSISSRPSSIVLRTASFLFSISRSPTSDLGPLIPHLLTFLPSHFLPSSSPLSSFLFSNFCPLTFLTSNLPTFYPSDLLTSESRQITLYIHRFFFLNMGPLVPHIRNNPCMLIEIVFLIFSSVVHKQIFFFVNQR